MPFSYLRACAQVYCNSRGVGSDVSNSSKNFFITHVRFAPTHVDFVLCIHMCTHPWFTTSQSEANCSVYFDMAHDTILPATGKIVYIFAQ